MWNGKLWNLLLTLLMTGKLKRNSIEQIYYHDLVHSFTDLDLREKMLRDKNFFIGFRSIFEAVTWVQVNSYNHISDQDLKKRPLPHRYVFLLFKQSNGKISFDSPSTIANPLLRRKSVSTRDLIKKYDFSLFAGNFYLAEYDDYVPIFYSTLSSSRQSG